MKSSDGPKHEPYRRGNLDYLCMIHISADIVALLVRICQPRNQRRYRPQSLNPLLAPGETKKEDQRLDKFLEKSLDPLPAFYASGVRSLLFLTGTGVEWNKVAPKNMLAIRHLAKMENEENRFIEKFEALMKDTK